MKALLLSLLLVCSQCFAIEWSGTAFFIDTQGDLATAAHCVKGAKYLAIKYNNIYYGATVIAVDTWHDVAIIRTNARSLSAYSLQSTYYPNENITVNGFPLPEQLGEYLHVYHGTVVSWNNDYIALRALSYGGDSGGPIIDGANKVIGVLTEGMPSQPTNSFARPINYVLILAIQAGLPINTSQGNGSDIVMLIGGN